jgi:heat shock 70kDa protein 1/2/6/8
MACVGIDLGARNSCITVFRGSSSVAEVVVHDREGGSRTVPSFIAFSSEGRIFGDAARSQAASNPKGTVFDFKRMLGRSFSDVSGFTRSWPFRVVRGDNDTPLVEVPYRGDTHRFSAIELSAMLIRYLLESAERFTGAVARSAVICIPFSGVLARQAVVDAGCIAGLTSVHVVCTASVAAIPYFLKEDFMSGRGSAEVGTPRSVLVVDLGATSCSAALVLSDGRGQCLVSIDRSQGALYGSQAPFFSPTPFCDPRRFVLQLEASLMGALTSTLR